jgi:hypothetical protein
MRRSQSGPPSKSLNRWEPCYAVPRCGSFQRRRADRHHDGFGLRSSESDGRVQSSTETTALFLHLYELGLDRRAAASGSLDDRSTVAQNADRGGASSPRKHPAFLRWLQFVSGPRHPPPDSAGRTIRRLAICKAKTHPLVAAGSTCQSRHPETWSSWISRLARLSVRTNAR